MSMIWSSPLSDQNLVSASNQFALLVLGYLTWAQQWTVTDLTGRKILVENAGRHPCGSSMDPNDRSLNSSTQGMRFTSIIYHHLCPRELEVTMRKLVGIRSRSSEVLRKMQKAVLSGTLNIARTFKVAT